MGGSILPITIHNNKIYFLFGKERDIDENPGWSDFGGGTDKGETYMATAIREGGEEMTGFLGSSADIKKMLTKYGTYNIDYKSDGYDTYRCHIFPMKYDELLCHYYNNNQRFLQERLNPKIIANTKIFEKTQIKWFSFEDMKHNLNKFRSFYRNIVSMILEQKDDIERFVRSKRIGRNTKSGKSRKKTTTGRRMNRRTRSKY